MLHFKVNQNKEFNQVWGNVYSDMFYKIYINFSVAGMKSVFL